MDSNNITIEKESYDQSDNDSVSWHCGCGCDPWPNDMFQGGMPPDPEYEKNYETKKQEGSHHHICSKQIRTMKKVKKVKTIKKIKKVKKSEKTKEANRIAEEDKDSE